MDVTVRWFAGAAEAAGSPETTVSVAEGTSAATLLASLTAGNERLSKVVAVSSLLADGAALTDRDLPLRAARLDVLPPFAGG